MRFLVKTLKVVFIILLERLGFQALFITMQAMMLILAFELCDCWRFIDMIP